MTTDRLKLTLAQRVYPLILIYYWATQYLIGSDDVVERGSAIYFLHIIPISVFSLIGLASIARLRPIPAPVLLMLLFVVQVSLVAVIRFDFQTLLSIGLLSIAVLTVFANQLSPSSRLMNRLFLASIAASALCYSLGNSFYTIIPGYSLDSVSWRISLFPRVATSAFFAAALLIFNILDKDAPLRRTCLILSVYFLIFSGLRTALLACTISVLYIYLARTTLLRGNAVQFSLILTSLIAFIGMVFMNQLVLYLPDLGPTMNYFIFHSDADFKNSDEINLAVIRSQLWLEQLSIAWSNPVFGVGTYDFSERSEALGHLTNGSESFIVGLYARVGVAAIMLLLSILSAIWLGIKSGGAIQPAVGAVLLVAMLAYGGFIAAYDFVFLAMIGLIARAPESAPTPTGTRS